MVLELNGFVIQDGEKVGLILEKDQSHAYRDDFSLDHCKQQAIKTLFSQFVGKKIKITIQEQ